MVQSSRELVRPYSRELAGEWNHNADEQHAVHCLGFEQPLTARKRSGNLRMLPQPAEYRGRSKHRDLPAIWSGGQDAGVLL
jgi:hypothetical protein